MEAVSSIMQSGVFQELVTGMGQGLQNGELDLSKLMGTVQNMVGGMSGGDDDNNPMAMMNTMMANMNTGESDSNQQMPDLSNIMNMVGPMLGALNGGMNTTTLSLNEPKKE
jgi:hypothetical protein